MQAACSSTDMGVTGQRRLRMSCSLHSCPPQMHSWSSMRAGSQLQASEKRGTPWCGRSKASFKARAPGPACVLSNAG